jgi:nucleoside-triphosphatase THEP1
MVELNTLSEEQNIILQNIAQGKNVVVDAVAGSGKSTVVLSIADSLKEKRILQLTYNSMLRQEVKEKVGKLRLMNLKVHTYHSLAVRYYLETAHNDTGIRYIILNDLPPSSPISKYDLIVIDETQDMSLVYFQLVVKFINDMKHPVQLLILGDYMQGLYEFKGADIRFLTLAPEIWTSSVNLQTKEFVKCNMKMSYRITNQMCNFVNNVMLGENRLEACRNGTQVKYIRNSRINLERIVIYEITNLLENGVQPSDIFVLGASVKGVNSNIRKMENVLVLQGIPCHVPMFEMEKIDEKIIGGKVVFSSFHSVKGRQRKYVFIVGFDNGYLDFYARNLPKTVCPNTLYVGATRATNGLYLLENDTFITDRPLEFLNMTHHDMMNADYIKFKGQPRSIFYVKNGEPAEKLEKKVNKHFITPTELIKFISETVLEEISPILDKIYVQENIGIEPEEIPVPSIIKTNRGFYEEVSDLTGIAIQSMYYDFINYNSQPDDEDEMPNILYDLIQYQIQDLKANEHCYLKEIVNEIPHAMTSISDYLYLANVLVALQEKLYFKLKQIDKTEYNWLTPTMVAKCNARLENTIGRECKTHRPKIEHTIIEQKNEEDHENIDAFLCSALNTTDVFRFTARSDLITKECLWEIKCTSALSIDHKLQLVIYAWLWRITENKEKKFRLFNIKSGMVLSLCASMEDLNQIMVALLKGRYIHQEPKTDEEFLNECREKMVDIEKVV